MSDFGSHQELLSRLQPIDEQKARSIRRDVPEVPEDYVSFLLAQGWGEIGDSKFMIYEGPVDSGEVYPSLEGKLWLVGDDFGGYSVGFDRHSRMLCEIDPSGEVAELAMSFTEFLHAKLEDLS